MPYSKGPWKQSGYCVWSPEAQANVVGASAPRQSPTVGYTELRRQDPDIQEAMDNLALCALAPEMLEALRHIQRLADAAWEVNPASAGTMGAICNIARTIIAKAPTEGPAAGEVTT